MKKNNNNVSSPVYLLYCECAFILFFIFLYMAFFLKSNVTTSRATTSCILIDNYVRTLENDSSPLGVHNVYTFSLNDIPEAGGDLVFASLHSEVKVYIDDQLAYSLHKSSKNHFTKTPGSNWNCIPIYASDCGKVIRVEMMPAYKNLIGIDENFYFGNKLDIYVHLAIPVLFPFALSVAAIFTGILFVAFTITNIKNSKICKSLMLLGVFSLCIGLWKLSDMLTTAMIVPLSPTLSYVSYFCLILSVTPYVLFVKEQFYDNKNILWYIPCIANIIVAFIMILLQVTGIADMRDTLWMIHIVMITVIPIILIMGQRQIKEHGWTNKLKIGIICGIACLAGFGMDMIIFYASAGTVNSLTGILGFVVFIFIFGIHCYKETRQLVAIGNQAKEFEQMALHDQLTGCLNRTAYANYINDKTFKPEEHIVVMFDLNDLKLCNDTYGHDKGDLYIINSSQIIINNFSNGCTCYRIGGDEFLVLMKGFVLADCVNAIYKLRADIAKFNNAHPDDFPVQIACGYSSYDSTSDYDISDAIRRADRMMYNNKFIMKQHSKKVI